MGLGGVSFWGDENILEPERGGGRTHVAILKSRLGTRLHFYSASALPVLQHKMFSTQGQNHQDTESGHFASN